MRKRTRRKVWPSGGNPVALAMRQQPLTDSELRDLRLIEADALDCLASGVAQTHQVRELSGRLLAGLIMASEGIGPEAEQPIREGRHALARAAKSLQGFGLSDVDVGAVAEALQWLDAQRMAVTCGMHGRAIEKALHIIGPLRGRAGCQQSAV